MSQLFRLKNGTVLLSTEAPGGIYNSGQLKKIAELCSKELAIVKATEDQRLALFVKESEVENVAKQLRAMGLGFRHYQDSLHQPVSCLGELCEEHDQPAMATAMDITKEIASIQLSAPLKIGINGCARCCTPCHTLDIAVVGDASGYRISLGGKTRQMPEFASYFAEGVPAKELPKRLKAVIETFKNLAEEGEALHDVIERCGVTDFVKALAPYSQDAAQREDPFAKEAAATESVDDLALPQDDLESIDTLDASDDSPGLDEEASASDLDMDLAVDDDPSVADDTLDDGALDEIPIEKPDQGSLEDDLSLGPDDASLELNDVSLSEDTAEDLADDSLLDEKSLEASDDALSDEALLESSEDMNLDDSGLEDVSLTSNDDAALDDASLDSIDDSGLEDVSLTSNDDAALDDVSFDSVDDSGLEDVSLASEDDAALDDVSLDSTDDSGLEDVSLDASDDALLDDTSLESSDDELLDDASLKSSATAELDTDMNFDGDDINLDSASAVTEDDIDLDAPDLDVPGDALDTLPEADLDLDESMSVDDELPEDLSVEVELEDELDDVAMTTAETPVDEDLEGIPELDEDLALEELPPPAPVAKAPAPAPAVTHDDFGEELPGDMPELSDEEESQFEEKLHASIDEESRLIAKADKDPNIGDRAAALSLLENSEHLDDVALDEPMAADDELEEIRSEDELETLDDVETLDSDLELTDEAEKADEVLEPIQESMEEFPEPGPSELAHIKSRQVGQKLQGSSPRQQFKVSAITFQDEHMRVTFESGAYVDFDLSALGLGEERNFLLGVQNVSVTSTSEGYILEVDGMRLFHPKTSFSAAS